MMDNEVSKPIGFWRKKSFWFWGLSILAVILFTLALVLDADHYAEQLAAIRKARYPATLPELNEWYADVPAHENAALQFLAAANLRLISPRTRPDLPIVGSAELPDSTQPLSAGMREAIATYLEQDEAALALVHQAAALKASRFPVDFTPGYNMLLPHLSQIKALVQLLRLEALFHSDAAEKDRSVRSLESSFAVAHSLAGEPILISELVRVACVAITLGSMEQVLSRQQLGEAHLERLSLLADQALRDGETNLVRALAGERCFGLAAFKQKGLQALGVPPGASIGFAEGAAAAVLKSTGIHKSDLHFYLHSLNEMIQGAAYPAPKMLAKAREAEASITKRFQSGTGKFFFISRQTLPALFKVFEKESRLTAMLQAARVALAIEKYRLKENRLPGHLSELVPEFLSEIPSDPYDGQTLQIERMARGYHVVCPGASADPDVPVNQKYQRKLIGFSIER